MHRKGHFTEKIVTRDNFVQGFDGFADGKHRRESIQRFEVDLDNRLECLMNAYDTCSWVTPPYVPKEVFEPKHRVVDKTTVATHVIQWSAMLPVEPWLMDSFYHRSPACVPKKGTHFYLRQEQSEMWRCSQEEVYYLVQLDIHHYFLFIHHDLMKRCIREKLKDPKLLYFLDEFIDSFNPGLVLGVKLSQLLSGLYLASFDRLALRCFDIGKDPERFHYWQSRYVTDCFMTCRTPAQAAEVSKGVAYLNEKFRRYVSEGLRHYSRFADNITIKHGDCVFLHLMTELGIMILARDYFVYVNKSWNVHPTYTGNDICGYVIYHDHVRLRKRNKQALCRQVAKLRKKGYSERDIRLKCASRVGFAIHADTKHLLKKLHMERLGKKIKKNRHRVPFDGMEFSQRESIESLVCHSGDDENKYWIQLLDYKIEDSVIEKKSDGTPEQCLSFRYRHARQVTVPEDPEGDPVFVWEDAEHYTFSGSKVMIDQAQNEFTREDLPSPTVIKEFFNKQRKRFYKFT
ncbi:MAG: hypothetical protein IJP75_10755 [Bacteroidaceae bacterium]|nr:hypothetical protein [Bacteroidaceae bacterium]